ncbi:PASTA domain-containing protein [Reichenbachiella versicolor]|uniref:PASTA domain-containing protein n=1 Tax=Reichenbachiella versicolor TaxID=1821036 RepID=UPI000D6DE6E6|nr:PASTA domain-containing protein [Reichenbachiella versicolor]
MTKKDLFIHGGIAIAVLVALVLGTFYIVFPIITNHGESMTVPNLEGIPLEDLDKFLEDRDLRYEVEADSGYSPKYEPLAVLKQFPLPNSKVKQNRKIYVTLNSANPPKVKIPSLHGRSLKNAQLELRSLGLLMGDITYKPDFALNTVLEQYYKGRKVSKGSSIAKGSRIDFEVGDGLGSQTFPMLDLREMGLEEATFVLRGYGLKLGDVFYKESGKVHIKVDEKNADGSNQYDVKDAEPGTIFKQVPSPKKRAKIGQSVDLWIVEMDSTTSNQIVPSLTLAEETE